MPSYARIYGKNMTNKVNRVSQRSSALNTGRTTRAGEKSAERDQWTGEQREILCSRGDEWRSGVKALIRWRMQKDNQGGVGLTALARGPRQVGGLDPRSDVEVSFSAEDLSRIVLPIKRASVHRPPSSTYTATQVSVIPSDENIQGPEVEIPPAMQTPCA